MKNEIDNILNSKFAEDNFEEILRLSEQQLDSIEQSKEVSSILDMYNKLEHEKKENTLLRKTLKKLQGNKNKKNSKHDGVLNRAITDFNEKDIKTDNKFPGEDHPIFVYFYQLANQYPNRDFLISSINKKIREKQHKVDVKIEYLYKDIDMLNECKLRKELNPESWQEGLDSRVLNLYNTTTIDTIEEQIRQLKITKENMNDWKKIKNGIKIKTVQTNKEIQDNLYYNIIGEFDKLFEFCTNVGGVMQYGAKIPVKSFKPVDVHSALTVELEKQIGLCEEPFTHNFFFSDGEGRLVPFEIDRNIMYYIHENTTFIKFGKKSPEYRSGRIISSDDLFKKVPKYVNKVQHKNPNLVGFNNKFYNIKEGKEQPLNSHAPILPLKNCKTELYLDEEIEYNPMQHIFNTCFKEEDKKALLAYIGCCLYDKGYTQRQESIFLMSKGETGKSTLVKAICEIFYKSESQLVNQLGERFGFSIFADNDCVIIDEIQQADKEFSETLKNISTGNKMPIEKKNVDLINLPAENVPRVWFIGNQFPKTLYYRSSSPGVYRRILCIIPTQPIQDLGYTYDEITTDSCKQWLVKEATLEYMRQGLHLNDRTPIQVDDNIKLQRMEMCTFPEKHFMDMHFEAVYRDDDVLDTDEFVYYEDMHNFVYDKIIENMLEPTIKKGVAQTFIKNVKEVFNLGKDYRSSQYKGKIKLKGIKPKSEEAIDYINEKRMERENAKR